MAESKAVAEFRTFLEKTTLQTVPESAATIGAWQERNTQRYELYRAAYAELIAAGLNDVTATAQLQGMMADINQAMNALQVRAAELQAARDGALRTFLNAGGVEADFEEFWAEAVKQKQAESVRAELDKNVDFSRSKV